MARKSVKTDRAAKAAQLRQEAARKERRNKIAGVSIAGIAVLAIAGGTWFGISQGNKVDSAAAPEGATSTLGFPVTSAASTDGAVRVDIYEDFQCPACGSFESAAGPGLNKLVEEGDAVVNYHMMSFLGPESVRATAAAACAVDAGKFGDYHSELYAQQPAEQAGGYTIDSLLAAGTKVGLDSAEFTSCVSDQDYATFAKKVDVAATKRGVDSTPSVFIDGKPYELGGPIEDLIKSIKEAVK